MKKSSRGPSVDVTSTSVELTTYDYEERNENSNHSMNVRGPNARAEFHEPEPYASCIIIISFELVQKKSYLEKLL